MEEESRRRGVIRLVRPVRTISPGRSTLRVDRDLEVLSRLMDSVFEVPGLGWRFGLDALVGLVPGIGDLLSTTVSVYILLIAATRYRLSRITLLRMTLNIAFDFVVGSIPVVGDLFDFWWKANERNIRLLRQRASHPEPRGLRATAGDWAFVGVVVAALLVFVIAIGAITWALLTALLTTTGGAGR